MTGLQLPALIGTPSQIEWAERIRPQVEADFSRLAKTLATVAGRQTKQDSSETQTLLSILEEKRLETMQKNQAGYFIRNWQEITDQVRQLIQKDARYETIRLARTKRAQGELQNDNQTAI